MNKLPFAVFLCTLTACTPDPSANLPPSDQIDAGMNRVLADTGAFAEVSVSRVVGRHYLPGADKWQIIACFRYADANGNRAEECNDTFSLFALDNGRWVVSVNRNGVYRWRELNQALSEPAGAGDGSAANKG